MDHAEAFWDFGSLRVRASNKANVRHRNRVHDRVHRFRPKAEGRCIARWPAGTAMGICCEDRISNFQKSGLGRQVLLRLLTSQLNQNSEARQATLSSLPVSST